MSGDNACCKVSLTLIRDSVCMADDLDSPHEHLLYVDASADLLTIAEAIATSGYLPMPSDAWGWTIEALGVEIGIMPRLVSGQRVERLRGDPAQVTAATLTKVEALYVRPGSPVRSLRPPPRRIDATSLLLMAVAAGLVMLTWWLSR